MASASINFSGSLELKQPIILYTSSVDPPFSPNKNTIGIYGEKRAGKMFVGLVDPVGYDTSFQTSFSEHQIRLFTPASAATVGNVLGWAFTAGGLVTHPNIVMTTTSYRANLYMTTFTASKGISAGIFNSHDVAFGGAMTGAGGFYFASRFAVPTGSFTSSTKLFVGMMSASVAATAIEPSTNLNYIGVGWDTTDATASWVLMTKDASTARKIVLTASADPLVNNAYARRSINTNECIYDMHVFMPTFSTTASVSFFDIGSGVAIINNLELTGNIPSGSTPLRVHAVISSSFQASIQIAKLYLEVDI